MAGTKLPEVIEEAFFERYFECGDDEGTVRANVKKACSVLKAAYETADRIATAAEDGECFDDSQAILAFQTIALAKHFFDEFIVLLSVDEQKQWKDLILSAMK